MPGRTPVVLVHGYSDVGASFEPWRQALIGAGYAPSEVQVAEYRSLTNEVTIKDIAEAFDRALRTMPGLGADLPFDVICHSTGMLVVRAWLAAHGARRGRLKRLVALAPATNGSPLAHKGRGFLGAVFKGNRKFGADFLEAGDQVLDGLELASRFTWDLAHADLFDARKGPYYRFGRTSPYVFILCGTAAYGGLRGLVNEDGTDGTVRWAGCSLDSQKFTLDLVRGPTARAPDDPDRFAASDVAAAKALPMPLLPVAGKNHATIVSEPEGELLRLVLGALGVGSDEAFRAWLQDAEASTKPERDRTEPWQQFVVRAVDERGDSIPDWYIEIFTRTGGRRKRLDFALDVHPYRADPALRCFHVNLAALKKALPKDAPPEVTVRIVASSGTELVGYHGINSERLPDPGGAMREEGVWDAEATLPATFGQAGSTFFYPFTTTFVEMRLNRDPLPFGQDANKVCYILGAPGG